MIIDRPRSKPPASTPCCRFSPGSCRASTYPDARGIFVCHFPCETLTVPGAPIEIWDLDKLADLAVRTGLSDLVVKRAA
jgi:hypothetical protein